MAKTWSKKADVSFKVSIVQMEVEDPKTKVKTQVIGLKQTDDGKFNQENVAELLKTMRDLSKKMKLPIHQWAFWDTKAGNTPVLLVRMPFRSPYVVLGKDLGSKGEDDKPVKTGPTVLA